MLDKKEWFPRFADVPGVSYQGSTRVDRSKLQGANAQPIKESRYLGECEPYLYWPGQEGSQTSASPAAQAGVDDWSGATEDVLHRLEVVLELPGYASDYHFAIQGCTESLWKRRVAEPGLLLRLEALFWMDIELVRSRPQPFAFDPNEHGRTYVTMFAFRRLYSLYFQEGFVHEALEVARLCEEFGQGSEPLAQITAIANAEVSAE